MNYEIEKKIINYYLDINSKDESGNNYLHNLVDRGEINIIKYFLKKFFNNGKLKKIINNTNDNNETPLFIAVKNNYQEIAQLLINYGADKNIKNKDGIYIKFDYSQNGGAEEKNIIYGSRSL